MPPAGAPTSPARYLAEPWPRAVALLLLLASLAVLLWLMFQRAWVGEDAFITFRTVEQFVHGNGLRWNPDERVQVYTHPLWMFACIPLYAAIRDIPTAAVALGLACSAGSYLVLGSRYYRRPIVLLLGFFLPLVASRTYLLYGTSGFENSMSNLCYAAFALIFLRGLDRGEIFWGGLALSGSLAVTNRLDTVLAYIPPIAWLMLRYFPRIRWGRFLAGYLPIVAWLLFATFYYGFPYPNTALAKVNEEVAREVLLHQGLYYLLDLLRRDPAAFFMLGLGLALTVGHLVRGAIGRDRERSFCLASLGLGALFYGGYVVYIGGSFLSGRHFMLPLFIMTALWAEALLAWARRVEALSQSGELPARLARAVGAPLLVLAVVAGAAVFTMERGPKIQPWTFAGAISDPAERLDRYRKILPVPKSRYVLDTQTWTLEQNHGAKIFWRRGERIAKRGIGITTTIGITSIAAGRDSIIIDRYALSDPLLARLPPKTFRMAGHFKREVPEGYKRARMTGKLDEMNPHLAEYYRHLRTIIRGPLFSWDRIAEIWRFNRGDYDSHLDDYAERRSQEPGRWSLDEPDDVDGDVD